MPVTKTARRALRSSLKKQAINTKALTQLEIAIRTAQKSKKAADIIKAFSLADRAAKRGLIHRNKAARLKSSLSKLLPKSKKSKK